MGRSQETKRKLRASRVIKEKVSLTQVKAVSIRKGAYLKGKAKRKLKSWELASRKIVKRRSSSKSSCSKISWVSHFSSENYEIDSISRN